MKKIKINEIKKEYKEQKKTLFEFIQIAKKNDMKNKNINNDNSNLDKSEKKNTLNSTMTRIHYYFSSVKMFLDHPIIGVGAGNFGVNLEEYMSSDYFDEMTGTKYRYNYYHTKKNTLYPHNSILRIAAENGILGIIAITLLFFNIFKIILRLNKKDHQDWIVFLLLAVIFIFIQSLFDDFIHRSIFWISLGILSSISKTQINNNDIKKI